MLFFQVKVWAWETGSFYRTIVVHTQAEVRDKTSSDQTDQAALRGQQKQLGRALEVSNLAGLNNELAVTIVLMNSFQKR